MRILLFIPTYKREAITELCFASVRRFIDTTPEEYEIDGFVIASNENSGKNVGLAFDYGFMLFYADNYPLGQKKNHGLTGALGIGDRFEWDYLMELDSDTLINPNLLKYYAPMFENNIPYFGINRIGILEMKTRRFMTHIPDGEFWITGRCIRRDVIERVIEEEDYLWTLEKNSALGWDQACRIYDVWGPEGRCRQVDSEELLFVDMKTDENITSFNTLLQNGGREVIGEEKARLMEPFAEQLPIML